MPSWIKQQWDALKEAKTVIGFAIAVDMIGRFQTVAGLTSIPEPVWHLVALALIVWAFMKVNGQLERLGATATAPAASVALMTPGAPPAIATPTTLPQPTWPLERAMYVESLGVQLPLPERPQLLEIDYTIFNGNEVPVVLSVSGEDDLKYHGEKSTQVLHHVRAWFLEHGSDKETTTVRAFGFATGRISIMLGDSATGREIKDELAARRDVSFDIRKLSVTVTSEGRSGRLRIPQGFALRWVNHWRCGVLAYGSATVLG